MLMVLASHHRLDQREANTMMDGPEFSSHVAMQEPGGHQGPSSLSDEPAAA